MSLHQILGGLTIIYSSSICSIFSPSASGTPSIHMLETVLCARSVPEALGFLFLSSLCSLHSLELVISVGHSSISLTLTTSTVLFSLHSEVLILDIYFLDLEFTFGSFL